MYLKRLILSNFKNVVSADLAFSPKINCIYGDNGEGKTNLLDAVYYLSMTKSFLQSSDHFTYTHGTSEAALHGVYDISGIEEKVAVSVRNSGEKIVKRNGKTYQRISEHIGLLPVVIISPSDTSLIMDSGEERRRFMNILLSQTDKEYLRASMSYNRALVQRNKLLKGDVTPSEVLLDAFSQKMDKEASYIHSCRKNLSSVLEKEASRFYAELSGGKEEVSMEYVSDLNKAPLKELMANSLERDLCFKYTTTGIQRDDLSFLIGGHPMKKCSSQGQQKSFLISLKLAQFSIMRSIYGYSPILLLDDVFDKLDMKRVEYLINMVAREDFGQIFITDSNKVRISGIVRSLDNESKFYNVKGGVFDGTSEC